MGLHSFRLPDIGEGVVEGEVVEWFVAVGDAIVEDQPLLSVMTDKATVEIPSPVTGTVAHLSGDVGDILPVGEICAQFEVDGDGDGSAAAPDEAATEAAPAPAPEPEPSPASPVPSETPGAWATTTTTTSTDDPEEIVEWTESILAVNERKGAERAHEVLDATVAAAREAGVDVGHLTQSPYLNTIAAADEPAYPGDLEMEARIRDTLRWNAMMMVTRANKHFEGLGGHISTYASIATLWEVGLNHKFRGKDGEGHGDHVYWQGHASPGLYARAWMEGRFDHDRIEHFRREAFTTGLSSYPHPRLMPDYWEYPTVSMGLGAMTAIRQARFNRYLRDRGLVDTDHSRVWYFMGDGESDEPESLSELTLASREHLDNLTMVVNCNLQRLDGPVRGNTKIVQELAARFTGAGWNVIKCLWGRSWDALFAADSTGALAARLSALTDGDEQRLMTASGDVVRAELFNTPELAALVAHMSDADLEALTDDVGGHDPVRIHAAYRAAVAHKGQPTVILARSIKGYGLGPTFAGRNATHGKKKADDSALHYMRDTIGLAFTDEDLEDLPYIMPEDRSDEVAYMLERREALGGFLPERRTSSLDVPLPPPDAYAEFDEGSGKQSVSTTMAFVRLLRNLTRAEGIGERIVPIVPDEARTFGMDPLFSALGIYAPDGQLYKPVDHKVLMKYKESRTGQILEEGINEAGAMSTFIASGTSYATQMTATVPFYIYYSMFGFQRIGDLVWSAADSRCRGFLMGATSGRTTLNGEGLQHQDGHSLLIAMSNPAVRAYDPAYAYEMAAIIKRGMEEMHGEDKDVIYYITAYNENFVMPAKAEGADEGILRGLHRIEADEAPLVRLLGSGSILPQAEAAAARLRELGVACEVWSATSYGELRREAMEAEAWNTRHPSEEPRTSWVSEQLDGKVPVTVAVSDNMAAIPDLIRPWVGGAFHVLGTEGFGRSDTRENLRRFYGVDADCIVLDTLSALARAGEVDVKLHAEVLASLGLEDVDDVTSI